MLRVSENFGSGTTTARATVELVNESRHSGSLFPMVGNRVRQPVLDHRIHGRVHTHLSAGTPPTIPPPLAVRESWRF